MLKQSNREHTLYGHGHHGHSMQYCCMPASYGQYRLRQNDRSQKVSFVNEQNVVFLIFAPSLKLFKYIFDGGQLFLTLMGLCVCVNVVLKLLIFVFNVKTKCERKSQYSN